MKRPSWQFRGLICLSLLTLGVAAHPFGATAVDKGITRYPARTLRNGKIVLASTLQQAIVHNFPGFHQVGDVSTADFDGNGLKDAAFYLTNRRHGLPLHESTWLFVAFHQMPSGRFRPVLIARRRDPSTRRDPDYHRPGRFDDYLLNGTLGAGSGFPVEIGRHRTRQMTLRHDGIVECHRGCAVWFFEGGRYHQVWPEGGLGE